ncbi:hypothetical protein Y032_0199g1665 [Ancylostoma ceylanicum]|uniref:Uncharacterized protein n=1 Tax=Ancylostoma ceylanicum TaxID=53326 RepID=A0A016SNV9_9BILA|nr:hypothetical protein Y032_0199g1665 [Ancylostoma ceylanicum]
MVIEQDISSVFERTVVPASANKFGAMSHVTMLARCCCACKGGSRYDGKDTCSIDRNRVKYVQLYGTILVQVS